MAFYISNDEADRLARELAAVTGESLADAMTTALRERLERVREAIEDQVVDRMMMIAQESASLLDGRTVDSTTLCEKLYDEYGLPRRPGPTRQRSS